MFQLQDRLRAHSWILNQYADDKQLRRKNRCSRIPSSYVIEAGFAIYLLTIIKRVTKATSGNLSRNIFTMRTRQSKFRTLRVLSAIQPVICLAES